MNKIIALALFAFCLVQCKPDPGGLTVSVAKISLRESPGVKTKEILTLEKSDQVTDLGEVSHFESEISFEGRAQRAPWLKVEASGNRQGWIFAGAVSPAENPDEWMIGKRLDCYFGHPFTLRLYAWREGLDKISGEQDFALAYREGIELRNTIVEQLYRRAEQDAGADFFWLNQAMPGFIFQKAVKLGRPQLLADYRFWLPKALKSAGANDDDFLFACLLAFPVDSIESSFPSWRFQLSETEGASRLGSGNHLKMLKKIDEILGKNRMFEPEMLRFKEMALDDILNNDTKFWQSGEQVLQELDEILAHPPACVQESELTSLQYKRKMLAEPEKFWIKVNMRSGD